MTDPASAPARRSWPLELVLAGLVLIGGAAAGATFGVLYLFGQSDGVGTPVGPGASEGGGGGGQMSGNGVAVEAFIEGLDRPIAMAFLGGPDDGIFVAQQTGLVSYVEGGEVQDEPVLDLVSDTLYAGEMGMLGIALHPEFADNGRMYITYVNKAQELLLVEYTAPDGIHVDPASAREFWRLPQGSNHHKGGALLFGPDDGLLYVSVGEDAWPTGDTPDFNDDFRGTILRIDVDGGDGDRPYGIPEGNAFTDGENAPEVFDYGLRNPWRMSIDSATGDLYIADVGSERYEEVSRHRADVPAGLDFGWGAWEGFECRRHQIRAELNCDDWADATPPVLVIEGGEFESGDCAIIGGYVYHGTEVPALDGLYVFADYCSGRLRAIPTDEEEPEPEIILDTDVRPGSFGIDAGGELYLADVDNGTIFRIVGE
jgi:glucose/arabinose dehydrogenase